jgi:predicted fused transcriptional regulator/phosphomethylpyrimidine kinase
VVTRIIDALDLATRADVSALEGRLLEKLDGGAVDSVARDGGASDHEARRALDGGAYDSEARDGINSAAADARAARASLDRAQRLIGVDAGVVVP